MIVVSVIGIILAFAVLIFAAYKKISMFLAAVLAAAIVALFGGLDVAASLVGADGPFLIGMKDFVGSWLVIFALGALLGTPLAWFIWQGFCMTRAAPPGASAAPSSTRPEPSGRC